MGPWIVVAMLAQTTSSSTTTTTTLSASTSSGAASSGGPAWWVVVGAVLVAAVSLFTLFYEHRRAAASVKINVELQRMNDALVDQNEKLHNKVVDLYTQIEGLGLGQQEAQAQFIKFQGERIIDLQQQVSWLEEQESALQDLINKPSANSAMISAHSSEALSRIMADNSKLLEERQRQHIISTSSNLSASCRS